MKPITQLIAAITHQLQTIYHDPVLSEQYAWWILEAITGKKQAQLIANPQELTPTQHEQLALWLTKLINKQMPIQYLIGSVPFNNVEILVEPPILLPRPETEEWCFNLIEQLKTLKNKNITILDLCSGTGCIALSVAKALPQANIYAGDINPQAVVLGIKNAQHNGVTNVAFLESDLFKQLPSDQRFDLIVGNPPYIAPQAWEHLDPSVKQWEDPGALRADDEGLAIIERIIAQAPHYIRANQEMKDHGIAQLTLEIDNNQGERIAALLKAAHYNEVKIIKDLEGKPRIAQGRVDYVATHAHKS